MPDTFKPIAVEGGKANQKVERKLLMTFVDVSSSGGSSPEWELQGRSVEDASVEYNHDASQTTDILGKVDTDVAAAMPQITMDPNTLRAGQKLNAKLVDIERPATSSSMGRSQPVTAFRQARPPVRAPGRGRCPDRARCGPPCGSGHSLRQP